MKALKNKLKIDYQSFGLKRIDTYIINKFLGTYFFCIVLILSISVVFDLTEKLDIFFETNAPLKAIVFDYYLNFIPYYMNMFSPLFYVHSRDFSLQKWPTTPKLLPFFPVV